MEDTNQITLSTTATEVVKQATGRKMISITNLDTGIIVYISNRPNVSVTTGMPLYPMTTASFYSSFGDDTVTSKYAVAASGTPTIAILEGY